MDQYIGKMLDNRYEVLERIGTGGMAVVYKARCHRLNRLVAIKILKPELASDEDFLRRFQSESQAVAMLSHINIVSIYDVCRSDGLDYIVMELIDGMSLKQYMIKRGTPLNWREALHFITQIVRALGHAHSRGIVHRDIKPHNIMVLRDGSVKVTDFGIARLTSAAQATLTQEALGSVHYISPEQAKGSHVDGRSDLYSVGVMLYEMLTGRLPFEGETPVFVAIQHINSIPIAPRDLNPDIPEALEAITMKAMAPNADQRYLTAEDMLEDLKEFRRNPGCPLPKQEEPTEEEVDEPTMVVPVNAIKKEELSQVGKTAGAEKPDEEPAKRHVPEEEESRFAYEKPSRRGMPPVLIGIFAIIAFLIGVCYFLYSFILKDIFTPAQEYVIPDLRGYTIEDITNDRSLLQGFGFEVQITISDSDYEAGQICRQYPVQNTIVKNSDTVIYVTVSTGEQEMFMPDIYNEEARVALNLLQNEMKLKITEQKEVYNDEVAKGRIVSFTPIEGTRVEKGDSVTIVISKGPEPVLKQVLPFIDLDIAQVISQMESMGLVVGKTEPFYSDQYAAGRVIWQSIPAGTPVEPGTVIDFHVSKGPDPSLNPSGTDDPGPTEDIPLPSEGIDLPTTERTITVDLTGLVGTVHLRIIVGDYMVHDSVIDSATVPTVTKTVYGSGVQEVFIYINGELTQQYDLDFNA